MEEVNNKHLSEGNEKSSTAIKEKDANKTKESIHDEDEKQKYEQESKNDSKQNADDKEHSSNKRTKTLGVNNVDNENETKTSVMRNIVAHKVNNVKNHQTTRKGQTLYPVTWYDYIIDDDTL